MDQRWTAYPFARTISPEDALCPSRAIPQSLPGEVGGLLIQIDPARERFLADHARGGIPLLPTVMALDLLIRAAGPANAPATVVIVRDLEVGLPILVINAVPLALRVMVDQPAPTGSRVCEIRAETGAVHYRAEIQTRARRTRSALTGPGSAARWPVQRDLIYPPFFHGPTFQVVGGLGRVADGVVAVMADELPGLRWSSGNLQIRPRLLELFMQGCGLHAFAASGRMMIPSRIDLMTWYPAALRPVARAAEEPAVAHISPRISMATDEPDTARYEGVVVAADGQVLLTVEGYHTVDLGVPREVDHASALRARLNDDLIPAMSTTDVLPQPQGVRP